MHCLWGDHGGLQSGFSNRNAAMSQWIVLQHMTIIIIVVTGVKLGGPGKYIHNNASEYTALAVVYSAEGFESPSVMPLHDCCIHWMAAPVFPYVKHDALTFELHVLCYVGRGAV